MAKEATSQKFTKQHHLLDKRDFDFVFRKAIKLGDSSFTVLARKNKLSHPRLGLAIAKKHAKLAVARNRIKRVVRESFRSNIYKIGSYDLIVMAKPGIDRLTRKQLRDKIDQLWSRLK